MTLILGVEHAGGVWVGGDSFVGTDATRDAVDRPKFWTRGSLLIGFAGSIRGSQAAQRIATYARQRAGEDDLAYLVRAVAEPIRRAHAAVETCREGGFAALIALKGRVYSLQPDYAILRSRHGYGAVGSGEDGALTALAVTAGHVMSPRPRVLAVLEAVARHHNHVSAPFFDVNVPHRAKR